MKTLIIFLLATGSFFTNANAQFSENFDQNISGLNSNCWVMNQINYTTTSGEVINGTGSAFTNPPTSITGERTLATPFLDFSSTTFTTSFSYKTSSKITGNATRTLNIRLVDSSGNFTSLDLLVLNKNTPTTVLSYNKTLNVPVTGTYRLEIRIGGATGDGNSRVIFDDLYVSASPHYASGCNVSGTAIDDSYTLAGINDASGNVMNNDQFPSDGETYSSVLVAAPSSGTLVLNADGSFIYTPDVAFAGGTINFTYHLIDNGYAPTPSNVATVTLSYPLQAVLPVELLSFNAAIKGDNVVVKWKVDFNYEGNYYEVEKSEDGRTFSTVEKVYASAHLIEYTVYEDHSDAAAYYRLKIVNNDESVEYSKTVLIKGKSGAMGSIRILGNPVGTVLQLSLSPAAEAPQSIQIYSITGVRVQEVRMNASNNINQYSLNVQHLQAGTYIVTINAGAGRESVKFVKR